MLICVGLEQIFKKRGNGHLAGGNYKNICIFGVLTELILSTIIVCMLTTNDKKEIKQIVKKELKPVEDKLEVVRGAVVKIEKDRKVLWDIWDFIKDHTKQLKNHETRISNLESSPKN